MALCLERKKGGEVRTSPAESSLSTDRCFSYCTWMTVAAAAYDCRWSYELTPFHTLYLQRKLTLKEVNIVWTMERGDSTGRTPRGVWWWRWSDLSIQTSVYIIERDGVLLGTSRWVGLKMGKMRIGNNKIKVNIYRKSTISAQEWSLQLLSIF